jgi:hypothetical protein
MKNDDEDDEDDCHDDEIDWGWLKYYAGVTSFRMSFYAEVRLIGWIDSA